MANATNEVIWLQLLLKELRITLTCAPLLQYDYLSVDALSANPAFPSRSKHFELDLHFVRKHVYDKRLAINHVPSSEQALNVLTIPLSTSFFNKLRKTLTVEPSS